MVRYSKLPFRALVRDYGVDLCYTPMVCTVLACLTPFPPRFGPFSIRGRRESRRLILPSADPRKGVCEESSGEGQRYVWLLNGSPPLNASRIRGLTKGYDRFLNKCPRPTAGCSVRRKLCRRFCACHGDGAAVLWRRRPELWVSADVGYTRRDRLRAHVKAGAGEGYGSCCKAEMWRWVLRVGQDENSSGLTV